MNSTVRSPVRADRRHRPVVADRLQLIERPRGVGLRVQRQRRVVLRCSRGGSRRARPLPGCAPSRAAPASRGPWCRRAEDATAEARRRPAAAGSRSDRGGRGSGRPRRSSPGRSAAAPSCAAAAPSALKQAAVDEDPRPSTSSRCLEPVTVPAAPRNVSEDAVVWSSGQMVTIGGGSPLCDIRRHRDRD